jgi:hypothetical protein
MVSSKVDGLIQFVQADRPAAPSPLAAVRVTSLGLWHTRAHDACNCHIKKRAAPWKLYSSLPQQQSTTTTTAAAAHGMTHVHSRFHATARLAPTDATHRIAYRLQNQLPALMRSHGVTHWILSQREYHEDVAWRSVTDPTRINARRRTVMIFTLDPIENVISERSFVSFKATVWEVSELQ